MKKLFIMIMVLCSFAFAPVLVQAEDLIGAGFGISEEGQTVVSDYSEEFEELETSLSSFSRSSRSSIFSSSEASSQLAIMILVIFASFAVTSTCIYQFVLKKQL